MHQPTISPLSHSSTVISRPDVRLVIWLGALSASFVVVGLATVTPWVSEGAREVIRLAYQTLCHQEIERSFTVGGIGLAVCHRCLGIYAGIAAGLLAAPAAIRFGRVIRDRAPLVLALGFAPLVLDWGLDMVGLLANTPATRFGTGLIAGVVGGVFLNIALWNRARCGRSAASTNRENS